MSNCSDWDSQQAFARVGGTHIINMSSLKAPPRGSDYEAVELREHFQT